MSDNYLENLKLRFRFDNGIEEYGKKITHLEAGKLVVVSIKKNQDN